MAKRHIDYYLDIINKKSGSGGGGQSVTVEQLNVSANGTYTAQSGHAYSPVVVDVPSGAVDVERKDVNFFSWDGHRIMSFTHAEVDAMTELPPVPVVEGFTNGVWNSSLGSLQYHGVKANVGPYYDYAGTASKFIMKIDHKTLVQITLLAADNTGGTIDWGDGSPAESFSYVDTNLTLSHTYQPGMYEMLINGDGVKLSQVYPYDVIKEAYFAEGHSFVASTNFPNYLGIKRMVGGGVLSYVPLQLEFYVYHPSCRTVGCIPQAARHVCFSHLTSTYPAINYWRGCSALEEIYVAGVIGAVPIIDERDTKPFYMNSLSDISINKSVYGDYAFRGCIALADIVFPEGVMEFGADAFSRTNIHSIEFPSTVTSIDGFNRSFSLQRIRFNGTTPPSVASANVFAGIRNNAVIEVPAEALDAYKTATNLSQYADKMEGF